MSSVINKLEFIKNAITLMWVLLGPNLLITNFNNLKANLNIN